MDDNIKSYDNTTLFCPSGMQQFKETFKDKKFKEKTIGNVQSCLRLNDFDEIGDGSHYLYFNMIGLFSFRHWTVEQGIKFWMEFLTKLGVKPDYITIHPDKLHQWSLFYDQYDIEVREEKECVWSDGGDLKGYCTEFYKDGLEIGNIVNIDNDSLDVGFGFERLDMVVNKREKISDIETLRLTIEKCIECGFKPSGKEHGYVLRKMLRELRKRGGMMEHEFFLKEKERFDKCVQKYQRLKEKFKDKDKLWWFDTHGIDLDEMGF